MTDERSLPHNLEAERAVLGSVLLEPELLDDVELLPSDFYRDAHSSLWRLLKVMREDGDLISTATVIPRLRDPDRYGGLLYVSGLSDDVPSTVNVGAYADLVRDLARKRALLLGLQSVVGRIYDTDLDLDALLAEAESTVQAAGEQVTESDWVGQDQDMEEAFAAATAPPEARETGASTGYPDLDALTGGLRRGKLVLIAGRPGSAKSTLADNITVHLARAGHPVGVLSLEMKRGDLAMRRLASEARVNGMRLLSGDLSGDERAALRHARKRLAGLPIFVDDETGLTVERVRQKIRRLKKAQPGLRAVVIDYFARLNLGRGDKRWEQASLAAIALANLAKDLDITLILLSQIGRQVEQRADKRPLLSDLRETGALEEAADTILFTYRDSYYNRDSKTPTLMEVIVGKGRSSATGTAYVNFSGPFTRIDPLTPL